MGKDKKKKKVDGMTKTLEKTAKKELKSLKKEFGEDDIDQLLSEIKKKDAAQAAINISVCEPPTPRSNASWLAHPSKPELILFGGELYNGATTSVYNDLLIYNLTKKEWRKVTSATCPPPRSAHQAVIIDKPEAPEMWIFGGEFTSPSGNQFHHYRDLWMLNLTTYAWELKAGGEKVSKKSSSAAAAGPSARSGHRMIAYKHKLIVFGGFFDSGYDTKYHSDMHVWDMDTMAWLPPVNYSSALAPSPRSGFGFFVNEANDTAFVYGGFAMETKKKEAPKSAPGKKVSKSAGQAQQVPVTYSDFWSINLVNNSWTQVKKRGYFPAAGRFAMGVGLQKEKARVFLFGGVKDDTSAASSKSKRRDDDDDDDDADTLSTNFNDLYAFETAKDRQRFYFVDYKGDKADKSSAYEVSVKVKSKPKDGEKKEDDAEEDAGESSVFDFNPVLDALPSSASAPAPAADAGSDASLSLSPSVSAPVPAPRRSALLCFKGTHCYLYGGVMEIPHSDAEHTFGDLWCIDTSKSHAQWELIMKPQEEAEWAESDDDEGDDDEEEEDKKKSKKSKKRREEESNDEEDDDDDDDSSSDDEEEQKSSSSSSSSGPNLKPTVGESLTVYFQRTKSHWLAAAVPALEADRIAAAEAAIAAAKQAEIDAKERAEEEARRRAEAEAAGEEVDAAAAVEDEAAALPVEKEKKSKKDKKSDKEKESKKSSKEKKSDKSEKSAGGDDAAVAEEKELRTKAFEMASARFLQR